MEDLMTMSPYKYVKTEPTPVSNALFWGGLVWVTYMLHWTTFTIMLCIPLLFNITFIILKIQIHFLLKKQRKIEQARCKKELEQLEAKWNLQHQRFQEDLENTLRALSDSQ